MKHRRGVLDRLTDAEVRETVRRSRAVRCEAHRFLGLARFRDVPGGGLYAPFEPDHDVLGMLVGPFHLRMGPRDWMLHDVGRRTAWVSRQGVGEGVSGVRVPAGLALASPEQSMQELWQSYFRTIAIADRINPGVQRSKMPVKTWKHLVETPRAPRPQ